MFGTVESGEHIARFVIVIQEANLAHGVLHVGLFNHDQVFVAGMDFLAAILERELNLVQTGSARSHQRANAKLRKSLLFSRFFRHDLLRVEDFVLSVEERNFDFHIFQTAVVQKRELEADFALRCGNVFKFADEHAARSRDFASEILDTLGLSVFVVKAAEVGAVVGPLVEEETGNLRVALESRNLVVLALERNAVNIGVERFEVRPNGELAIVDERFHRLEFVLDRLLALDAARTGDGGCALREERIVLERHQNLVLDVVQNWFFFILEVAVAKTRIRHHELFVFLVQHVGEVVRVSGTRV